ncbi:MAG: glycosyltransferase family 39 protein [Acidobacteria bacterium]|nr:glycosyltransferase family 39 protein [Acidobacteriota bacterium]
MKLQTKIALVASSCAVSALLRIPYFQHPFIFVDEAWWANGSKVLLQGGRLYHDIWLDKQPPIFMFCALLFKVVGLNMNAIHFGSLLLVFLISTLLFCIGSSFFSPAVGGGAAIIYALASTTFYTPRITGMNTETIMVVFTTAAMFCFLQGLIQRRLHCFFWAGFLSSCAAITKPVAMTQLLLFVGFLALTRDHHMSGSDLPRTRSTGLLCGGYLCVIGLLMTYIIRSGILMPWWEQSISYEISYVASVDKLTFLRKLVRSSTSFGLIYTWLWLLIWQGRASNKGRTRAYRVAAYWLLTASIGVVAGRRFYANYFIQVLPPMALLGAMGATYLWQNRHLRQNKAICRIVSGAFLLSFVWFHARTLAHWYFFLDPHSHEHVQLWGMCKDNRKNADIARHVRSRTISSDPIFVWGPKPELYFLSDRVIAAGFMEYDVGADVPRNASHPLTQLQTVQTLGAVRPRYIIDVQRNARLENYPQFRKLIEEHYQLETLIHEARIYRLVTRRFPPHSQEKRIEISSPP